MEFIDPHGVNLLRAYLSGLPPQRSTSAGTNRWHPTNRIRRRPATKLSSRNARRTPETSIRFRNPEGSGLSIQVLLRTFRKISPLADLGMVSMNSTERTFLYGATLLATKSITSAVVS